MGLGAKTLEIPWRDRRSGIRAESKLPPTRGGSRRGSDYPPTRPEAEMGERKGRGILPRRNELGSTPPRNISTFLSFLFFSFLSSSSSFFFFSPLRVCLARKTPLVGAFYPAPRDGRVTDTDGSPSRRRPLTGGPAVFSDGGACLGAPLTDMWAPSAWGQRIIED